MTRILGIDPGLSETGWALLERGPASSPMLSACGLIKTPSSMQLPARLGIIHSAFETLMDTHAPDAVAIEEMFFLKAAHTIRGTLQARGVVLLAVCQARRPISEYNPRTVKLALTGSGTAGKAQMQNAVKRSLGLAVAPKPDDVADAAAVAICHLRSQRIKAFKVLDRFGAKRA